MPYDFRRQSKRTAREATPIIRSVSTSTGASKLSMESFACSATTGATGVGVASGGGDGDGAGVGASAGAKSATNSRLRITREAPVVRQREPRVVALVRVALA